MAFQTATVSIGANTKKSDYDIVMDNTKALKDEAITLNGTKTFAGSIIDKNGLEVTAMQMETVTVVDESTGITQSVQETDIDVPFSFTPTAIQDCRVIVWDTAQATPIDQAQTAVDTWNGWRVTKAIDNSAVTPIVFITNAVVGTDKITVSIVTGNGANGNIYYRIICTAIRTA